MAIDDVVREPSLAMVLQISGQAREQAAALVSLLKQGLEEDTPELRAQTSKAQKLLISTISHLRGLHRNANLAARETKAQTADARQEVDRLHLQLQNLYYEQRHLEGEIAACESYEHKYEKLQLKPEDEFLAEHPELVGADEHAIMTARIQSEHAERKALDLQRQEAANRRATLIAENKLKKDNLALLDREAEKFIDGGKRVEELFEKVI